MIWLILFLSAFCFLSGLYALNEKQTSPGILLLTGGLALFVLFVAVY